VLDRAGGGSVASVLVGGVVPVGSVGLVHTARRAIGAGVSDPRTGSSAPTP